MDLGKKIIELRKKNNLTQEQLAKAVGVSTPAVCKWETGVSIPEVTLLAPIARRLNTNLNELLSFHETLSSIEIEEIMNEINGIACESGLNNGIAQAHNYLKQYPNVDELKLRIAMLPIMMAQTADEEYQEDDVKFRGLLDESTKLLEELTHADTDEIRMAAILCTATRYMEQRRFDEADTMLKKLPEASYDAKHIYPTLYLMKGEEDKAVEYSQANMLQDIQHVLVDIRVQHTIYLKNKDYKKALKCAKDYLTFIQLAGIDSMCGNELFLDTYLAMGNTDKAIKYYLNYIDEIKNMGGSLKDSFYYSNISDKVVVTSNTVEPDIRIGIFKYVLMDERYRILRESDLVIRKLELLKNLLDGVEL